MTAPHSIAEPRISLVLPVYNGAETLDRALTSIAAQSHTLDEVVVINDGSTDATAEIIGTWEKRLPIVVVQNSHNLGLISTLQHGVARASGDLLLRLDADDAWLPNHVEIMVGLRKRYPDAVLYASRALIRTTGPKNDIESDTVDDDSIRAKLLWDNPLVHSAVAFDKQAYETVGGYVSPKYAEDYDLWIRLLRHGSFAFSDETTAEYYVLEHSASSIKREKSLNIRFGLQRQAIRAFARQHPVVAVCILPIVLLRQVLNKVHST
jgi:GT2 family glycosyltransferase